jgi:hypothetical protein
MVDVIRLFGDPHRQTQLLLPWYINGTLDEADVACVDAHLSECAECRADLQLERSLGREIARLPTYEARGSAALFSQLESQPSTGRSTPWVAMRTLVGRPIPLGWALAAQAAAMVLMTFVVAAVVSKTYPVYVTLGAGPADTAADVIVMFKPTTSEADLRGALLRADARLVDGPTAADAYILHVSKAQRQAAVAQLKADPHVTLAEPIDGPLPR